MTRQRTICVVTGTRAEYGLLQLLMREIASDPELRLQTIATGMHLSPEFGSTEREIKADGFEIDARVEMLLSSDSAVGTAKSMGLGTIGFADALDRLRPDLVLVLGDRFEILAAAQAAAVARIPIAHIHGGETTEGAYDECFRHAITKMAQWHFVAAEAYRQRVVQLGEDPRRVFNFGAPALDLLERIEWMDRTELETSLGIALGQPLFLLTYHPVTLGGVSPLAAFDELLAGLEAIPEATLVFTYPNADTGGRALIRRLNEWLPAHEHRARAFQSLGQRRYSSMMRLCDVIVGNSSSALIEGPALKTATVNIGDRQAGRLKATSVIDAPESKDAIVAALRQALSPEFRAGLPATESLYGAAGASRRIKDTLKAVDLFTRKSFFDIRHGH